MDPPSSSTPSDSPDERLERTTDELKRATARLREVSLQVGETMLAPSSGRAPMPINKSDSRTLEVVPQQQQQQSKKPSFLSSLFGR